MPQRKKTRRTRLSGYCHSMVSIRSPTAISASSSSRISRRRATSRLSPRSGFPPGNSQSPARCALCGRRVMRILPWRSITAATTSTASTQRSPRMKRRPEGLGRIAPARTLMLMTGLPRVGYWRVGLRADEALVWCPRNPLTRGRRAGRGAPPRNRGFCALPEAKASLSWLLTSARCGLRLSVFRGGAPAPPGALSTTFWDRTLDRDLPPLHVGHVVHVVAACGEHEPVGDRHEAVGEEPAEESDQRGQPDSLGEGPDRAEQERRPVPRALVALVALADLLELLPVVVGQAGEIHQLGTAPEAQRLWRSRLGAAFLAELAPGERPRTAAGAGRCIRLHLDSAVATVHRSGGARYSASRDLRTFPVAPLWSWSTMTIRRGYL